MSEQVTDGGDFNNQAGSGTGSQGGINEKDASFASAGTGSEGKPGSDASFPGGAGVEAGATDKIQAEPMPEGFLQDEGLMNMSTGNGTGGVAETTGGATRGGVKPEFGGRVGGFTSGTGITGMDVNSTDVGRSDITGGGTAAGLGATKGGDTA